MAVGKSALVITRSRMVTGSVGGLFSARAEIHTMPKLLGWSSSLCVNCNRGAAVEPVTFQFVELRLIDDQAAVALGWPRQGGRRSDHGGRIGLFVGVVVRIRRSTLKDNRQTRPASRKLAKSAHGTPSSSVDCGARSAAPSSHISNLCHETH